MKHLTITLLWAMSIIVHSQELPVLPPNTEETTPQIEDIFKVVSDPDGREYFPKDKASFYTLYLLAMKEPSIKAPLAEGVRRAFRFTYLRSFHDPMAIRIVENESHYTIRVVMLERDREYRPIRIKHDQIWNLDVDHVKTIREVIEQENFWKPLNDAEEAIISFGMDGSQWIFEMHDKDGYRMIDVWSPDVLAGLNKENKDTHLDLSTIRDFLIYQKAGHLLLDIGRVLPPLEERY